MDDRKTIMASPIGNPNGLYDNPWPTGHPVEGERVAILVFEVTSVDGEAENTRSFHVAPVRQAQDGPIVTKDAAPQGIKEQWTGRGTGTVLRPTDWQRGDYRCEVVPDDPSLS